MHAAAPSGRFSRALHWLFEASLAIKGLLAGLEGTAGLVLLLAPNSALRSVGDWLTRHELMQDPGDRMAMATRQILDGLSIQSQHFYALYLMAHGLLKLAMVVLLARQVRWAYPCALVLLAGFVVYQIDHGLRTQAPALFALSALDTLMFVLVTREWRLLPRKDAAKAT